MPPHLSQQKNVHKKGCLKAFIIALSVVMFFALLLFALIATGIFIAMRRGPHERETIEYEYNTQYTASPEASH